MFKHILIPTDGSAVAAKAVKAGIALAKEHGARVTGFHAAEPVPQRLYGEGYVVDKEMAKEFERRQLEAARKHVGALARAARKAGVPFTPLVETSQRPYDAIVDAARRRNCDLILMTSHGRKGLAAVLLGSETRKVLTHARVPVLVVR